MNLRTRYSVWGLAVTVLCFGAITFATPTQAQSPVNRPQVATLCENEIADDPIIPMISSYYGNEPIETITVWQNTKEADDVLATCFVAGVTRLSPVDVNNMRKQSKSWQTILLEQNVDTGSFFRRLRQANIPKEASKYAWSITQFKNWSSDPDYYDLYDKTFRHIVGLDFLVNRLRMDSLQAMKAMDGDTTAISVIQKYIKVVNEYHQPSQQ